MQEVCQHNDVGRQENTLTENIEAGTAKAFNVPFEKSSLVHIQAHALVDGGDIHV